MTTDDSDELTYRDLSPEFAEYWWPKGKTTGFVFQAVP